MLKKLLGFLLLLIISGIGLSLYLPTYEQINGKSINYQIDSASLDQPLNIDNILLDTDKQENTLYGLQLGLFSHLKHAVQQAKITETSTPLNIFKATDTQRDWYLLTLGPFEDLATSHSTQRKLESNGQAHSKLIRWPVEVKSAEENGA